MNGDLSALQDLSALRDVLEPPPVSWAPQTVGWLVVAAVAAVAAAVALRRAVRRYRADGYRRAALAELARIEAELPATAAAPAVAALLKRTALAAYPRAEVATLTGADWLAFLDRTYGGDGFRAGPGRALPALTYARPADGGELGELYALGRAWIARHRRDALEAPRGPAENPASRAHPPEHAVSRRRLPRRNCPLRLGRRHPRSDPLGRRSLADRVSGRTSSVPSQKFFDYILGTLRARSARCAALRDLGLIARTSDSGH